MRRFALALAALSTLAVLPAHADDTDALPRTPSKPKAAVYFQGLKDGATVKSPVTVRFGLRGMGVAPAGVEYEGTGHHHLIIDAPLPDLAQPIPMDDNHRHFGGGQTQTRVKLTPGTHTLQLVLADHYHIPHDPPLVSKQITITVKDPETEETTAE